MAGPFTEHTEADGEGGTECERLGFLLEQGNTLK